MSTSLEVLFAPAEFAALPQRDLSQTTCVVFDVLRATSTMITALANGAVEIIPVAEIAEALAIRAERPDVLLAGERNGLRIRAEQTGGIDFDLGNSPREFTPGKVRGRTIVMTTTNGTRALRACAGARHVLIASFLNLGAVAAHLTRAQPEHLLLVCSGTVDQAALEDALAAGALCDLLWADYVAGTVADSALLARDLYRLKQDDLLGAVQQARNGRRLSAIPELRDDIPVCLQRDTLAVVAKLTSEGTVRKVTAASCQ
ncbi:MAG: 2-phosphosulfolactate phosphatase [Verrucomicrobia bacterium]|nr:2-phosphosulfolactate phosphatase [Verrucomicrobiota bacterium]